LSNATYLAPGIYWITISVNDTLNNVNSSVIYVNVTGYDVIAPMLNITFPVNGSNFTILDRINYTVSDPNLDSCWWTQDGGVTNNSISCGTNITGESWLEGWHTVTLYANDTYGNERFNTTIFQILRFVILNPNGTKFVREENTSIDVTKVGHLGPYEILAGIESPIGNYSASLWVNFSANVSFLGSIINTSRTDRVSVFHNTSPISKMINKSLLVPYVNGTGIYVCPNATSLDEVNESCPGKVEMNISDTVNGMECLYAVYDGEPYYKVTNISGTGGAEPIPNVTPFCGDGVCNGGETCSSCPADCDCGGGGGGGGTTTQKVNPLMVVGTTCLNEEEKPAEATATVTIYKPDDSVLVEDEAMEEVGASEFNYSTYIDADELGVYVVKTKCISEEDYVESVEVVQLTEDWDPFEIIKVDLLIKGLRAELLEFTPAGLLKVIEAAKAYLESLLLTSYLFTDEERILVEDSIKGLDRLIAQLGSGGIDVDEAQTRYFGIRENIDPVIERAIARDLTEEVPYQIWIMPVLATIAFCLLLLSVLLFWLYLLVMKKGTVAAGPRFFALLVRWRPILYTKRFFFRKVVIAG
jgi:hypothetical protein